MGKLGAFGRFVVASGKWGMVLMTGGLFSCVAGLYEHMSRRSVPSLLWVGSGIVLFMIGAFLAWHEEEKRRIKAEADRDEAINKDRPEVIATLIFGPGQSGVGSIGIENRGSKDAFNIQIQPVSTLSKNLTFSPIPILSASQGKVFPLMDVNGFDEFHDEGELQRLLRNWAVRQEQPTADITLTVQWNDASGHGFHSTCEAHYEVQKDKCRTVIGPICRKPI